MSCCVYLIKCLDETVPEIYIGSTSNYKKRQISHKSDCNNLNSKDHNIKLYRFMRSKGGFHKFKFEIIEDCVEDNKLELEKMYIDMYNPELNTIKYNFDKKEYNKEYNKNNKEKRAEQRKKDYEKNKEKYKEYYKDYNENNKKKLLAYSKDYNENNKEKISEQKKQYYIKNKEKYNEKICCRACRCEIKKREFKRHCETKKHINNLKN